jgi:hypothetical protein
LHLYHPVYSWFGQPDFGEEGRGERGGRRREGEGRGEGERREVKNEYYNGVIMWCVILSLLHSFPSLLLSLLSALIIVFSAWYSLIL